MTRTLTLTITLPDKNNKNVVIDEVEENSGERYRMVLSPTLEEFNERVGKEIWSWVSIWMDARDGITEDDVAETMSLLESYNLL